MYVLIEMLFKKAYSLDVKYCDNYKKYKKFSLYLRYPLMDDVIMASNTYEHFLNVVLSVDSTFKAIVEF